MRKLRNFLVFNSEQFFRDKEVQFITGTASDDGVKINAIIMDDRSNYGKDADNEDVVGVNVMEKFRITVPDAGKEFLKQFKMRDAIELYDFKDAKVWGNYSENLSVVCKVRKANAQRQSH